MTDVDGELYELLDADICEGAREDLLDFAIYTRGHYEPNWHHLKLIQKLIDFANGKIKRLMVFMPPRHGKSELVSRLLPAFLLGRNPDATVIACSYGQDLAQKMNRDVARIMDSAEYRKVFPLTRIPGESETRGRWARNNKEFEIIGRRGSYRCAGVGGSITGMGGDYVSIDDPVKNQEQAYSAAYREKVWEWYTSTVYTRIEGETAGVLLTMTRWHEDDLAGRLLSLAKEDPTADQWEVVCFPAVHELPKDGEESNPDDPREEGEALWVSKYPVKFLEKNKAQGSYVWNALFQQRPSAMKGNIVKRDWLRYWSVLPDDLEEWLTSWDMSFKKTKKGSFVVGQVWARKGANFYLIDQYRKRANFPTTLAAVLRVCQQFQKAQEHLVESAANGPAIVDSLQEKVPGMIDTSTGGESKEARLVACSSFIESGNVYLPNPTNHPWVTDLVEELVTFPNAAQDDQVDSLSQALNRYKSRTIVPSDFKLDLGIGLRSTTEPSYGY